MSQGHPHGALEQSQMQLVYWRLVSFLINCAGYSLLEEGTVDSFGGLTVSVQAAKKFGWPSRAQSSSIRVWAADKSPTLVHLSILGFIKTRFNEFVNDVV